MFIFQIMVVIAVLKILMLQIILVIILLFLVPAQEILIVPGMGWYSVKGLNTVYKVPDSFLRFNSGLPPLRWKYSQVLYFD